MPDITIPSITLSASWEPEDPEVESVWIILKEAIDKIDDENDKNEADFRADRIYEKLSEARTHYSKIRRDDFFRLPLDEQMAIYNSLYACLWSAYKDRLPKMLSALGYQAGFISAGNDFEQQAEAFTGRYPDLAWLPDHIRLQKQNWQDTLRDNRNPQQHDGDLRGTNYEDLNDPFKARVTFARVCNAIEGIGVSTISYKLPVYWNIIPRNNGKSVFDREPRYDIKHSIELSQNQS